MEVEEQAAGFIRQPIVQIALVLAMPNMGLNGSASASRGQRHFRIEVHEKGVVTNPGSSGSRGVHCAVRLFG